MFKRMKIGIVTNLYPPFARGGAENIIVRTVGELLTMGHEVFVITGQPKQFGKGLTLDRSSTERIYRFFPKNLYFSLDDYRWAVPARIIWHLLDALEWSSAKRVGKILRNERPDVVITHNLKGIGLRVPEVIRRLDIPHVHIVHDLQLIYPSGLLIAGHEHKRWWSRPIYSLYQLYCQREIGNPQAVISPSEYLKAAYLKAGFFKRTAVEVLRNPLPSAGSIVPRPPQRQPGPLNLFYIGQLAGHKGVDFLLEAFQKLPMDARLLIVGDGPLRGHVETAATADKRIRYLGFLPSQELSKFFSGVDAVVVPSLCYENSPTVIYEALSAGVPVIAADIGGVGELVRAGENGYLFKPGNQEDFLRCVSEFDKNKEVMIADGQKLRASVADYALDKYAKRLLEILTTVINRQDG
jgi:glycosyltransferase involved in cell wall biosynthesis